MTDVSNLILPGPWNPPTGNSPNTSTLSLNGSSDKVGWVFQALDTATITHLGLSLASDNNPPDYTIGLQGIDTDGYPDGTYLGGGSPASATFNSQTEGWGNSTFNWVELDNSYDVTIGDYLAYIVEYDTGTIGYSNQSTFRYMNSNIEYLRFPAARTDVGGGWVRQVNGYAIYGVKGADFVWGFPVQQLASAALNTNGHRAAMKVSLDSNIMSSAILSGIRMRAQFGSIGSVKVGIWEGTTERESISFDIDYINLSLQGKIDIRFDNEYTLDAGTEYYIGIERVDSTNYLHTWSHAEANDLNSHYGGQDWCLSEYNGSSWSDTTTERPIIDLLLKEWTSPSGGTYTRHHKIIGI